MLQKLEDTICGTGVVDHRGEYDEEILSFIHQLTSVERIEWSKKIVCGKLHYTGVICDHSTGYFWVCFINLSSESGYLTLQPALIEIINKTTKRLGEREQKTCVLDWKRIQHYWTVQQRPSEIESLVAHIEEAFSSREEGSK